MQIVVNARVTQGACDDVRILLLNSRSGVVVLSLFAVQVKSEV